MRWYCRCGPRQAAPSSSNQRLHELKEAIDLVGSKRDGSRFGRVLRDARASKLSLALRLKDAAGARQTLESVGLKVEGEADAILADPVAKVAEPGTMGRIARSAPMRGSMSCSHARSNSTVPVRSVTLAGTMIRSKALDLLRTIDRPPEGSPPWHCRTQEEDE